MGELAYTAAEWEACSARVLADHPGPRIHLTTWPDAAARQRFGLIEVVDLEAVTAENKEPRIDDVIRIVPGTELRFTSWPGVTFVWSPPA